MFGFGILSALIFLPLLGVAFILLQHDDEAGIRNTRWAALWTTIVVFGLSLVAWSRFDIGNPGFQFVEQKACEAHGRMIATRPRRVPTARPRLATAVNRRQ